MPADDPQQENIASAVTEVSERVSLLVREEIELARAEVMQKVSSLVRGAAAVAAGAVFGVFAIIFGLLSIAWVLNNKAFGDFWAGFVVVFGALLIATLGAFLFAWRKLKVGAPPTPTMAIDEAKKIRETVATGADAEPVVTGSEGQA